MRALLDVNLLIAWTDGGHTTGRQAVRWMEREASEGWVDWQASTSA